jgi:type II secretory pathway pseudopilin PulG
VHRDREALVQEQRGRRLPAEAKRGQTGETLVETLVTIAIAGLAIVTFIGALFAVVTVSQYHRNEARVETIVRSYAEQLKASVGSLRYRECATPADYGGPSLTLPPGTPSGYTATLSAVVFWDGKTVAPGAEPTFVSLATMQSPPGAAHSGDCRVAPASNSECQALWGFDGPCDNGLQRLTVTVSSTGGDRSATESVVVYKRDARCIESDEPPTTRIEAGQC